MMPGSFLRAGAFRSPLLVLAVPLVLAGCADFPDTRYDYGIDFHSLSEMSPQVWVDPDGCDHWIIDDGIESYMTPRVRADGTPVCREGAQPEAIYNLAKP